MVSVGSILLLSASVKLDLEIAFQQHPHSPLVELVAICGPRDARKAHARFSVAILTQSGHRQASSISCVAVVAQQQRQVIVRVAAAWEGDGDFRIDSGAARCAK